MVAPLALTLPSFNQADPGMSTMSNVALNAAKAQQLNNMARAQAIKNQYLGAQQAAATSSAQSAAGIAKNTLQYAPKMSKQALRKAILANQVEHAKALYALPQQAATLGLTKAQAQEARGKGFESVQQGQLAHAQIPWVALPAISKYLSAYAAVTNSGLSALNNSAILGATGQDKSGNLASEEATIAQRILGGLSQGGVNTLKDFGVGGLPASSGQMLPTSTMAPTNSPVASNFGLPINPALMNNNAAAGTNATGLQPSAATGFHGPTEAFMRNAQNTTLKKNTPPELLNRVAAGNRFNVSAKAIQDALKAGASKYYGIEGRAKLLRDSVKSAFGYNSKSYEAHKQLQQALASAEPQAQILEGVPGHEAAAQRFNKMLNPGTWSTNPTAADMYLNQAMKLAGGFEHMNQQDVATLMNPANSATLANSFTPPTASTIPTTKGAVSRYNVDGTVVHATKAQMKALQKDHPNAKVKAL